MSLSFITVIIGAILLGICLPLVCVPSRAGKALERFPRHPILGRLLATIASGWALWATCNAQINWVNEHFMLTCLLALVAWLLIMRFMDDLLSVRALGGLFLLAPTPILDAAFQEASTWRLVMVVFAYLLVILGMMLVWSPYLFRQFVNRWMSSDSQRRRAGVVGTLLSLFIIGLGLW